MNFQVVQTKAMYGFIVDDMEEDMVDDIEEDESNEDDELFDSVCSFCDNGGDLLWYEFLLVKLQLILMQLL